MQWLVCPSCGGELNLKVFVSHAEEIMEGELDCRCGEWYPLIHGVPRMLLADMRADLPLLYPDFYQAYDISESQSHDTKKLSDESVEQETKDRFGYEWSYFSEYECENFEEFIAPLPRGFLQGKLGLDVGCGAGRHVCVANKLGAEMLAIDLSRAVDSAYKNNWDNPRGHIVQADLYRLPFRQKTFDFIYSLGVLHHLSRPEEGYRGIIPLLKPGGAFFVWVYAHALRKVALEVLRFVTQRLSNDNIRRFAWLCNLVDYGIVVNCYKLFRAIPGIGTLVDRVTPSRISEYAGHGYRVSYADWYDRLSAPVTNYYKRGTMEGWLQRSGLSNTQLRPIGDSWWWLYGEAGS